MDTELKNSILKTGTTILGIVCKNGVVMASDRQSTAGNIVVNKRSDKTIKVGYYFLFSGCGLAAAIQRTKKILEAELRLKELKTKSRPTIDEAANLLAMLVYRSIRTPSMVPSIVGTLIAGVNEDGSTGLYTIEPAGSVVKVKDFDANFSSGMPYILGLLEREWKKDMTIQQGIDLAIEALKSSTQRDTGSGNGIDVFTITKDGIKHAVSQEIIPTYQ